MPEIVASYHRARASGKLFDLFYELFLAKSPEIPSMFAHTDFPHQKRMLEESLLEMLVFHQTKTGAEEILRLGERHRQLNVTSKHYELWLDALCEALSRQDPHFSPALERTWRDAMRAGISIMSIGSGGDR